MTNGTFLSVVALRGAVTKHEIDVDFGKSFPSVPSHDLLTASAAANVEWIKDVQQEYSCSARYLHLRWVTRTGRRGQEGKLSESSYSSLRKY